MFIFNVSECLFLADFMSGNARLYAGAKEIQLDVVGLSNSSKSLWNLISIVGGFLLWYLNNSFGFSSSWNKLVCTWLILKIDCCSSFSETVHLKKIYRQYILKVVSQRCSHM